MAHLENFRGREEYRRASRMVLGLGSFVEGKDQLQTWTAEAESREPHLRNIDKLFQNVQREQREQEGLRAPSDASNRGRRPASNVGTDQNFVELGRPSHGSDPSTAGVPEETLTRTTTECRDGPAIKGYQSTPHPVQTASGVATEDRKAGPVTRQSSSTVSVTHGGSDINHDQAQLQPSLLSSAVQSCPVYIFPRIEHHYRGY